MTSPTAKHKSGRTAQIMSDRSTAIPKAKGSKDPLENLAEQLDEYMRFRAGREGVEYHFSSIFYLLALDKGVRSFFGVLVSDTALVTDHQQPKLFRQWKAAKRRAAAHG